MGWDWMLGTWGAIVLTAWMAVVSAADETAIHAAAAPIERDLRAVPPDLQTPPMVEGEPAAGKRVRQVLPEYRETEVYHALYLPNDWLPRRRYPYDGVRTWGYPGSDPMAARQRLGRLKGRASFICHEGSVEPTRCYLASTGIEAPFTFQLGPFRNHNDAWVLRDVPERAALRAWLAEVLRTKPRIATLLRMIPG